MTEPRPSRKNAIQNLLIVLLSISAVALLFQAQQTFSGKEDYLSGLFSDQSAAPSASTATELTAVAAPVQFAVAGAYGRYGALHMTTTANDFAAPGNLLREALGTMGDAQPCQEAEFRAALAGDSVYYDFTAALPLSVLSSLIGADAAGSAQVRRLCLAVGESGVDLYLSDGTAFDRRTTKVSVQTLAELIAGYQPGSAVFAFELGEESLAPYTLLLTDGLGAYSQLTAASGLENEDQVLTALDFNPHTNSRYPESDGTEVVVEGDRTLRLRTDGTLVYDGGGTGEPSIAAGDATPTAAEAVLGCYRLLDRLLPEGSAALCLQSITPLGDGGWTVAFDYQINGVLIRLSDGTPAATVTTDATAVTAFTIHLRRYTVTETTSLLLPVTQAMAIARAYPGRELRVCYTDDGSATLSAGWLAE